jgi:hypothetical protein
MTAPLSLEDTMSVLNFLNRHNGVVTFFALSGPFIGRMISVRYLNAAWHNQAWFDGLFAHLTREQFEAGIMGSIGVVHANGEPVPAGIVCRINAELAYDRRPNGNVVDDVCTGIRDPRGNWRRLSLLEQDQLFPTEDMLEVLAEDTRVEGLPASAFAAITSGLRA